MLPLGDQLEVGVLLLRADHSDRAARAMDAAALPRPGVLAAIDVDEVRFAQRLPTRSRAVDHGLGQGGGYN